MFALLGLMACFQVMAQSGDTASLSIDEEKNARSLFLPPPSGSMIFPKLRMYSPAEGEFSIYRTLTPSEILARDRKLILTRMIIENPTPEFVRNLMDSKSVWASVALLLLGFANIGGMPGFYQLVPPVQVGGQPHFDDMIFLDPNFDPRIYKPSLPVPQYDPLDPSKPYKAAIREGSSGGKGASGPPPVLRSRYVIP